MSGPRSLRSEVSRFSRFNSVKRLQAKTRNCFHRYFSVIGYFSRCARSQRREKRERERDVRARGDIKTYCGATRNACAAIADFRRCFFIPGSPRPLLRTGEIHEGRRRRDRKRRNIACARCRAIKSKPDPRRVTRNSQPEERERERRRTNLS